VNTTRDYGMTYLFHDRPARANMGTFSAINCSLLVTLQWEWVMGCYFTPDAVLRDRRQKKVMK